MRGFLGFLPAMALAAACSSDEGNTDPGNEISVGGTYQTAVTMVSNSCPGQTVQQHPTTVNHQPGATALSFTHAGSTYTGTLTADGAFTTPQVTQTVGGIVYSVSLSGQFSETALNALVQVGAGRQPPCAFMARWAGPKDGDPNVIP